MDLSVVQWGASGISIIAVVDLVQRFFPQVTGKWAFLLVIVLGAVSPLIPWSNPVVQGIVAALAGAGFFKLAKVASGI